MKILMLIDSLNVGGAETHVESLARSLSALGDKVIVASSGGAIAEKLQNLGVRHLTLPDFAGNNFRLLSGKSAIRKIIRREAPDLVHAHTRRCAYLASSICKKYRTPLIVTIHAKFDMSPQKRIFTRFGDGVIAVSNDILEQILPIISTKSPDLLSKIHVIPNGVATFGTNAENH